MSDSPVPTPTIQEQWKNMRTGHQGFINAAGLGPIQAKKAWKFYHDINWEAGTFESGPGFVSRILTAPPDPERIKVAMEAITAAWYYIGWRLSRESYGRWSKAMAVALEDTKATRKHRGAA